MEITETPIKDLLIIKPKIFEDNRGYFFESYNKQNAEEKGINITFIQDNQSKSQYGVLRGLHYQKEPHAQSKLVRVLQGIIFDVAVDLREGSPTFGKWHGEELSDTNSLQLLVPKGFAHGFSVLSQTAVVFYKCDNLYHPSSEGGILYNDPFLNIDWNIPKEEIKVSEKDKNNPMFENANAGFKYQ